MGQVYSRGEKLPRKVDSIMNVYIPLNVKASWSHEEDPSQRTCVKKRIETKELE